MSFFFVVKMFFFVEKSFLVWLGVVGLKLFVFCYLEILVLFNNLVRGEVFYDEFKIFYLKVIWEVLNYDGGVFVCYYIVEYKIVKIEWGIVNIFVINKIEFLFLVYKFEIYIVWVWVVNSLGEGKFFDFIIVKLMG